MAKKLSKELKEWVVMLTVIGILFFTGWYKDVAGFLQRGLLETGLMKPSQLEDTRPASYDFQLINEAGRTLDFSEFQGKTVFINFWATWCPPCIAEMPDIHDLFEKVGSEVSFVMISVDQEPEKAINFIDKKGFEFPIYFLKNGLPNTYDTHSIPTTYVISPDGKIVTEQHGLSKYDTERFREFLLGLNSSSMRGTKRSR
ncbi:MAG: TlpA family protein disulfide reductase [Cytophagales bacterium]|nr:TlpA family protein disulfide reductase [Cytophagales bacterium]